MSTNETILRLTHLNDCLCQTIGILTQAQRIGLPTNGMGMFHASFVPPVFGVPTMDPRAVVDHPGFGHSGYNYGNPYPFGYTAHSVAGWPATYNGVPQTHLDPFFRERVGVTQSTNFPNTSWNTISPLVDYDRQRLQALYARQQYEAMAGLRSPFGI